MNLIILVYTLSFSVYIVLSNNEECIKDNTGHCNEKIKNLYTADLNKNYEKTIKLIEYSIQNYSPCNSTNCNCHASIIIKDLKPFKNSGITKDMIKAVHKKGTKYQIINHKLYREKDCMFPARCAGIEHFLLKLVPKLDNTELIINTRDWPQLSKHHGLPGPVFSFSKPQDYFDIMYPTWSFWEGGPAIALYPRGIGRWDEHRIRLSKASDLFPWDKKRSKAFFRGSRTSSERDPLIILSREKPELVDAKYTKNQAWKSDADTLYAPPAQEVSFEDHCKYKYLFNFRGVAASFRFKHLFLCKSVVFHVGDDFMEFFYPALKPWVHYIPVDSKATKEEIENIIQFAKDNDQLVQDIAERGYEMIWKNLKMNDITCYWKKLLKKYTKLLKYDPVIDTDMIEII